MKSMPTLFSQMQRGKVGMEQMQELLQRTYISRLCCKRFPLLVLHQDQAFHQIQIRSSRIVKKELVATSPEINQPQSHHCSQSRHCLTAANSTSQVIHSQTTTHLKALTGPRTGFINPKSLITRVVLISGETLINCLQTNYQGFPWNLRSLITLLCNPLNHQIIQYL